jgi:hypothetical protein
VIAKLKKKYPKYAEYIQRAKVTHEFPQANYNESFQQDISQQHIVFERKQESKPKRYMYNLFPIMSFDAPTN